MITINQLSRIASASLFAIVFAVLAAPQAARAQTATPVAGLTVAVEGIANPRGLAWDATGTMFIAVSGTGGDNPGPEGSPFSGGDTAAVVAVRNGTVTTVAEGLPSSVWRDIDWVWGVMDVAIQNDQPYALVGGGGAIHGNPDRPSGIYRIDNDGSAVLIADLGAWVDANPVAKAPPEGAPNNGSFFAMIPVADAFWVTDAVNGQVLQVTTGGEVSRIADLSAGHLAPTALAADGEGGAYVGFLTAAPYGEGAAKVSHVSRDGSVDDVWTGLTTVTGVAIAPDGALYVTELSATLTDAEPFLTGQSGRVLRRSDAGTVEEIATGLDFPVGARLGPDGALYVSDPAFSADSRSGRVLRIDLDTGVPVAVAAGVTPAS